MDTISKHCRLLGRPCKKKQPSSHSYNHYKECVTDPLIVAKLHFFSYIAGLLEPFLKLYQTDYPMVPFLFLDIKAILGNLLTIVVKPNILQKCNTAIKMAEMDLCEEKNVMKPKDIHMGFGAETEIQT